MLHTSLRLLKHFKCGWWMKFPEMWEDTESVRRLRLFIISIIESGCIDIILPAHILWPLWRQNRNNRHGELQNCQDIPLLPSFIPAFCCHHTILAFPGVSSKIIHNIQQENKTLWILVTKTWNMVHGVILRAFLCRTRNWLSDPYGSFPTQDILQETSHADREKNEVR